MQAPLSREIRCGSEVETARFAQRLASRLGPGDTLLLSGPIGAGKTHFARALIQTRLAAAGRLEDVPSPTFTLVQSYDDGLSEIWHADLYRLTAPEDVLELGLDDAFETAICLVEWPDRLGAAQPGAALSIEFVPISDTERGLRLSGSPDWAARLADLIVEPAHG